MLNPLAPLTGAKDLATDSLKLLSDHVIPKQQKINKHIRLLKIVFAFLPPAVSDYILKRIRLMLLLQAGQLKALTHDLNIQEVKSISVNQVNHLTNLLCRLLALSRETVSRLCDKPTDDLLAIKELLVIADQLTDLVSDAGDTMKQHAPSIFMQTIHLN